MLHHALLLLRRVCGNQDVKQAGRCFASILNSLKYAIQKSRGQLLPFGAQMHGGELNDWKYQMSRDGQP